MGDNIREQTEHNGAMWFEGPTDDDGRPIRFVIPQTETNEDYRQCIGIVLNALSQIEDRPAEDIVHDMASAL